MNTKKQEKLLKTRLQEEYGSLRMGAKKHGINYHRLVNICAGWITPKKEEIKNLKITTSELEDLML